MLTPDFLRKDGALETVVEAAPDVYNHNLETVPALYLKIRPGARYFHSLRLLQRVKELAPAMFTKSGIMVGLGETRDEVLQLMDDLRSADVDFLTIGQYLQPTRKHAEVKSFVTPDEFKAYERIALSKGFLMVSASPLTRSSYHAGDDFARLRAARLASAGLRALHAARPGDRHLGCRQEHVLAGAGSHDGIAAHPSRQGILAAGLGADAAAGMARESGGPGGRRALDHGRQLRQHVSICACRAPIRSCGSTIPCCVCLRRAMWRAVTSYGRVRADMAEGCPERIDLEFLRYIWTFNAKQRPRVVAALEQFGRAC